MCNGQSVLSFRLLVPTPDTFLPLWQHHSPPPAPVQVKKKLLLVNLSALLTGGKGGTGDLLKLIFREAQLYDALIFFDEWCGA